MDVTISTLFLLHSFPSSWRSFTTHRCIARQGCYFSATEALCVPNVRLGNVQHTPYLSSRTYQSCVLMLYISTASYTWRSFSIELLMHMIWQKKVKALLLWTCHISSELTLNWMHKHSCEGLQSVLLIIQAGNNNVQVSKKEYLVLHLAQRTCNICWSNSAHVNKPAMIASGF